MQKDLHIRARIDTTGSPMVNYSYNGEYIGNTAVLANGKLHKSDMLINFITKHNLNHHDSKPSHPGSN